MIVTLDFDNYICKVVKESGDIRFKDSNWGSAESTFLHHVKVELMKQGYDLIKKRMWKDGHLVSDTQLYIRTRSIKSNYFAIWNSQYALYDAGLEFNEYGIVNLALDS
jgi:hypothetical protein